MAVPPPPSLIGVISGKRITDCLGSTLSPLLPSICHPTSGEIHFLLLEFGNRKCIHPKPISAP